ncbi:hypothetical protein FEP97_06803 [Burkholderia pseudomultivorans]|nr:hypothetical protein [Burkholderia pseudomultivorans]
MTRHDRAGSYDRVIADLTGSSDNRIGRNPNTFSDYDIAAVPRVVMPGGHLLSQRVRTCNETDVMAEERLITNDNAS